MALPSGLASIFFFTQNPVFWQYLFLESLWKYYEILDFELEKLDPNSGKELIFVAFCTDSTRALVLQI